jgi:uncharacterized protein (DUF2384 family)
LAPFGVDNSFKWCYIVNMANPRTQTSPASPRGEARPLQNFADETSRARLTPAALEAVRNLAKAWGATGDQMAALLGMSSSTWDRVRADTWQQALTQDQLTRVSALVGVYKGLKLLFSDRMADRWPMLRNAGPLFANRSPVQTMVEEGIPVMLEVRRYVDALRGGL